MSTKKEEVKDNSIDLDEFRAYVLDNVKSATPPAPVSADIGLSKAEKSEYSLMKAIRSIVNPTDAKYQKEASFEIEASLAAADKAGVTARGIMIPSEIQSQNFTELLGNKLIISKLGARFMPGLSGNIPFPVPSAAYWMAEGGAPTEPQQTIDQVSMTPKTVAAFTDFSRQLILQPSVGIEQFVIEDLLSVLATAIDHAALYGSGASGQPTGISNTTGVNAPTDFAAPVPTFAEAVEMESAVATSNALVGNLAYLTDPTTRGGLKTTAKNSDSGLFVWENSEINGYRAEATSQVTTGDVFFGNWADLIIGMWGGLDLTVDPHSLSTTGPCRIVAFQSVDVAVRHPASFAYNNDGV